MPEYIIIILSFLAAFVVVKILLTFRRRKNPKPSANTPVISMESQGTRDIFKKIPFAAGILTREGRISFANQSFLEIFTIPEELPLESLFKLPFIENSPIKAHFDTIVQSGKPDTFELKLSVPGGSPHYLKVHFLPIKENNVTVESVLLIAEDLSQEKMEMFKVFDERLRLLALLNELPLMITALNKEGRVTFWNKECEQITGFSFQEVLKTSDFPSRFLNEPAPLEMLPYSEESQEWKIENIITAKSGEELRVFWSNLGPGLGFTGLDFWRIGRLVTQKEKLRQPSGLHHSILNHLEEAILTVDAEGELLYLNPCAERMLQYTNEESLGKQGIAILGLSKKPAEFKIIKDILNSGKTYRCQHLCKRKDGSEFDADITLTPSRDDQKQIIHYVVCIKDTTPLRNAREAVLKSEEKYRRLFNDTNEIMISLDETGDITAVNDKGVILSGYDRSELLQMNFFTDCLTSDCEIEFQDALANAIRLETPPPIDIHTKTKGGTIASLEARLSPVRDDQGNFLSLSLIMRDITQERGLKEELEESKRFLENIFKSITDTIFVVDENLTVVASNLNEHKRIKGSGIGFTCSGIFHNEDTPCDDCPVLETFSTGKPVNSVHQILNTDQWIKYHTYPYYSQDGSVKYVVVLRRDITHQKLLEKQLIATHKMESIGTLAGGIAHDFNNLLTGILGYTTLMMRSINENDPHHKHLQRIKKSSEKAADLTQQLLAFSRRSLGIPQPISVNRLLKDTLRLFQSTLKIPIQIETGLEENLWIVNADPGQISQVLMELFVNARDHMTEKGSISIRTANRAVSKNDIAVLHDTNPGEYVEIIIEDNGIGIPYENLPRIFEPFFTTKEVGKGSGMGLSMVFGIVKGYNGWIRVESEKNDGTCFQIYLPRFEIPKQEIIPEKIADPEIKGGNETILVVDDEEIVLSICQDYLSGAGYKVITAPDGETAIKIYQRGPEKIQVVMLDLTMPKLSGVETMKRLMEINPDVKVLLASGYTAEGLNASLLSDDGRAFIHKPFEEEELLRALRDILDAPVV